MSTDDAPVVVLGGSVAGLGAALFLSRAGRRVVLLDRDPETSATAAAARDEDGPRRGTPQAAHSHIYIAALRTLLADRAPDVLASLSAAGVRDVPLVDGLPDTLGALPPDVAAAASIDGGLVALAARRSVFETALRRAVLAEPGVEALAGTAAAGLRVTGGNPPRVTGVRLEGGGVLDASLVIDASGRRTSVPAWLAPSGVTPALAAVECGISYASRFYRLRPGAARPRLGRGFTAGASFDRYSCLVFPGDGDTFSVTFGVLPEDRSLRGLSHGDAFDAAVAAIPSLAPWTAQAQPLGPVAIMAGMKNRLRRWNPGDHPQVLGLAAVGDAAATSNPAHSRGCTLALLHAAATADAVAAVGNDPMALAAELDRVLLDHVAPWVADSEAQDRSRLSRWRTGDLDAPVFDGLVPTTAADALSNGELYGAAQRDATAWLAYTRLQNALALPGDVLADPTLIAHVRSLPAVASAPTAGPSHQELAALIAATTGGVVRRRGLVGAAAGAAS